MNRKQVWDVIVDLDTALRTGRVAATTRINAVRAAVLLLPIHSTDAKGLLSDYTRHVRCKREVPLFWERASAWAQADREREATKAGVPAPEAWWY